MNVDLEPKPWPPVALYVHVPFCVARCPYCDFVVYAGAEARGPRARTAQFFDALEVELGLRADEVDRRFGTLALAYGAVRPVNPAASPAGEGSELADRPLPVPRPPLQSVYFGGGTPSLMPPERVARLLAEARHRFGLAADAEITLEANPGPDERGDLAAFARAGVNRVSFGAQSFDASELRRLGRRHSPEDVRMAVAAARAAGIGDVNLDLLYEVPGQTLDSWHRSLGTALSVRPDHLSLYALTLDDPESEGLTGETGDHLPTLPGARRWRERARDEQDDDLAADQYELASEVLEANGWDHYEISNWSRPGHRSRHNLVYWQREPYEAIGPGAHAFDGAVRRWNAAAVVAYTTPLLASGGRSLAPETPLLPPGGSETIDPATSRSETLILSLRLGSGISAAEASEPPYAAVAAWAESSGLVERFERNGEARLRLTTRGRLMSNELFARLV